jgi:hypothetical protein
MYTSISSGGPGWTDLNIPSLIPGLAIIPWHVAIVNDRGDELMFRNSTNPTHPCAGGGYLRQIRQCISETGWEETRKCLCDMQHNYCPMVCLPRLLALLPRNVILNMLGNVTLS